MTALTHEQVEELLGVYSLDAVDPDEREAIEAHLPDCPRCRGEVADLREVVALLANNDDVAPEGIWDRIAEAIDEVPPPMRLDVRRHRGRDAMTAGLAAAAVVALLILGWQVRGVRDDNDRIQQQLAAADATRQSLNEATLAMLEPGSQLVRLTGTDGQRASAVLTESGQGYLFGVDLEPLPSGTYEVWGADASGAVVAIGSLDGPGVARLDVGSDVTELLVTVEPMHVDQPTTSPIMQGTVI